MAAKKKTETTTEAPAAGTAPEAPSTPALPVEYKRTRVEVLLEALQPIHQGSVTIGNHSELFTVPVFRNGVMSRVPGVSADAMRHGLRERMGMLVLDAAGLVNGGGALSAEALRFLFNGGIMAGGAQGALKLREMRELNNAMPHIALLGGCTWNQINSGKTQVENAVLACAETRHHMPEWMLEHVGGSLPAARVFVAEEQRVRGDAMREPVLRNLLSPGARDTSERLLEARETAAVEEDAKAAKASKGTMMPRTCSVIAQGALLYWAVTVTTHNVVEEDAFWTMLCAFLADCVVGGKSGSGHGRMRAIAANEVALARPSEQHRSVDLATVAPRVGETFRRHTQERAPEIRRILDTVTA